MYIKTLKLKNFKNFDDIDFTFKTINVIKGKNGAGKSTIKEAILFALYNLTPDGSKDTDRYIKKGSLYCEVYLETDKHSYFRRKSLAKSDIEYDKTKIRQSDLVTKLPPFEIFNSVFSISYFSSLNEKEQRELILRNTSDVDRLELFKKMGGNTTWLEGADLNESYTEVIKKINSKKLATSKKRDKYSAQLEYLDKFPIDKYKGNKVAIQQLEKLLSAEKTKLTLSKDTTAFAAAELKNSYELLAKLPTEEMKLKVEKLEQELKKVFKNVEIALTESYKSEMGFKEIFKFKINGLEYKTLSSGEKLRFDLAVSTFFNSLLSDPINCYFLDDSSKLDEDIDIPPQAFVAMIWPHELKVEST